MRALRMALAVVVIFGLGMLVVRAEEKKETPKLTRVMGKISKVEEGSITVTTKTDDGEKTVKVTVNADTKILIPTGETEEVKGRDGNMRTVPKMKAGAVADLKVDLRVYCGCTAENVAVRIRVMAEVKKVEKKEGEKKEGGDAAK